MLDVVAYICNYTYKFLDASLFMLDVRALAYSDTYQNNVLVCSTVDFFQERARGYDPPIMPGPQLIN